MYDVDWETRVIHVRRPAKRGRARDIPFGRETARILRAYLGYRSQGPLFLDRTMGRLSGSAMLSRLVDASRRAGLDRPLGPQSLRRYAATRITANGASEPVLFRIMGWEPDPRRVAYPAYIDLTPADLAQLFVNLSPLDQLVW